MSAADTEVRRHSSDVGWWEMVSRPASARLRRHILGYCGYAEKTVGFNRRRELPSGEVIVIVGFGPKLETTYPDLAPERSERHRSFVAGLHQTHCLVATPGTQAGIQLNLTPPGAHLLLGVPMHELTDRVVELDDLLGREGELLVEELYEARDWEARFGLLDAVLERRLGEARSGTPDVAWAYRRMLATAGRLRIGELCAELGCSRKHILRRFSEQIGVAPKTFARILRFERAAHLLGHRDGASWVPESEHGAGSELSWAEVAAECGYFDQAHMNRDFRQFAGIAPGALAAALLPDGGGLAA